VSPLRHPLPMKCAALFCFLLLQWSCTQDVFESPEPGLLEISFRAFSSQIPSSASNVLPLTLTNLRAVRADNAKLDVFPDPLSIRRNPSSFNALDSRSLDSSLILGQVYAPPAFFKTLEIAIEPSGFIVLDGYRFIEVRKVSGYPDLVRITIPGFATESGKRTRVVVALDLDRCLIRRLDRYDFEPVMFISSVVSTPM